MMEKEVLKVITSLKTKSCKMDAILMDILKKTHTSSATNYS